MAKNLIVTITGYAGEIKTDKLGGSYVTIPVPVNKKNAEGEWEVIDKHYFNVALDGAVHLPGDVQKDQFYEVTGELRLSKWTNDKGELQVSLWVSKAQFKKLATVAKSDGGRQNLEAFGAVEAPF